MPSNMNTPQVYALIAKHMRQRKPDSFYPDVFHTLKKDPEFLKLRRSTNRIQGRHLIRNYLIDTYGLDEKVLRYVYNGTTPSGKTLPNIQQCFEETIKECAPAEDVEFITDVIQNIDDMKTKFIDKRKEKLFFAASYSNSTPYITRQLKKAYHDFHADPVFSKDSISFNKRLGKFCFDVGSVLTDTQLASEFITKNFHLLAQPPESMLPEQKLLLCPDNNAIADTIELFAETTAYKNDENKENCLRMAKAFREKTVYISVECEARQKAEQAQTAYLESEEYKTHLLEQAKAEENNLLKAKKLLANLSDASKDILFSNYLARHKNHIFKEQKLLLKTLQGLFPEEYEQVRKNYLKI